MTGFRLGLHLSNQFPQMNRAVVDGCAFDSCSIGVRLRDATKDEDFRQIDSRSINQENFFARIKFRDERKRTEGRKMRQLLYISVSCYF